MEDPDTPPAVEEGEVSGDADVVRPIVVECLAVTANNTAASTPPPWITAIEPRSAATTDPGRYGCLPDSCPRTPRSNPNRYRRATTATPVSLHSWMTYFFRLRSRKRRAS